MAPFWTVQKLSLFPFYFSKQLIGVHKGEEHDRFICILRIYNCRKLKYFEIKIFFVIYVVKFSVYI